MLGVHFPFEHPSFYRRQNAWQQSGRPSYQDLMKFCTYFSPHITARSSCRVKPNEPKFIVQCGSWTGVFCVCTIQPKSCIDAIVNGKYIGQFHEQNTCSCLNRRSDSSDRVVVFIIPYSIPLTRSRIDRQTRSIGNSGSCDRQSTIFSQKTTDIASYNMIM